MSADATLQDLRTLDKEVHSYSAAKGASPETTGPYQEKDIDMEIRDQDNA